MILSYTQMTPFLVIGGMGMAVFVFCVLPIVLGLMALRQIDRSKGATQGRGLALLAILIGAVGLLTVPVLLVLGMVARSGPSISYGSVTPMPPPTVISVSTPAGAGGAGGAGGWGGAPGGNGGAGSLIVTPRTVLPSPVVPPPATAPRNTGSVGEQNGDDFGAVEKSEAPAPATQQKKAATVGEQNVDN